MSLSFKQVGYICEVARCKSISRASSNLRISQSSILAAIEQAESLTSASLFLRRKGHGVALTPAGHKFVLSSRKFLAAGEEFERTLGAAHEIETPVLRVGCFSPLGSLLIPQVLKRYFAQSGACEVILMEGDQSELREWLRSGDVDIIVTYDLGEGFGQDTTQICDLPAHAVLHRSDPDAEKETISIEQLSRKPQILLDLPETRSYLLALFDFAGNRPLISLRARAYETIRAAVANGLGASMLNMRPPASSPDSDLIVRVPIQDNLRQPTLIVVDPYGDQKPVYVKRFIQDIYEYIVEIGPKAFSVTANCQKSELIHSDPKLFP